MGCGAAHAADRTEVHAGIGVVDFGYKEFSESGTLLDREDGLLPGLALEVARRLGDWRLSGDARYFSGNADYDGRTNFGTPISTETDERMYSLSARVAREFRIDGWSIAPYAGYGWHRWQRDIKPTQTAGGAPVSGLLEVYTWNTAELGTLAQLTLRERFHVGVDLRLFRVLDPEVEVRFSSVFDEARLPLGERSGARVALISAYELDQHLRIRLELYHEGWSFGRSSAQPLASGGSPTGVSVMEPRSETRNTGVTLGMVVGF
jgi:hypothetical protein